MTALEAITGTINETINETITGAITKASTKASTKARPHTYQQTHPGDFVTTQKRIDSVLDEFSSHGLADLNKASLMDRVETKFVLSMHELTGLLATSLDYYSALEIDSHRVFNYENVYLDTPDFKFYTMHHNGKRNRHKVRHRSYQETGTGFLEIKFKSNKSRIDKTRIPMDSFTEQSIASAQTFLDKGLNGDYQGLRPQQYCSYKRIALANEEAGERITIDFDLKFSRYQSAELTAIRDYFIVEVKQLYKDKTSPFLQLMEQLGSRPSSFSKYCFGCYATAGSAVKKNRFKPSLQKYLAN